MPSPRWASLAAAFLVLSLAPLAGTLTIDDVAAYPAA